MHSRLPIETAVTGAQPRTRAHAPTGKNALSIILDLQQVAGNRVVSQLVGGLPAVQRVELYVHGGGKVTSVNGPGTNERKAVAIVQTRLITLGVLTNADAAADRARMKANKGRLSAGDIPATLDAITRCGTAALPEPMAKKLLKVDLVAGVGTGETNDADDVELVLNLLHEESHVTNDEFHRSEVVLAGDDRTVDPAALPGFLAGLTKLKRGFAGGYPFRGSTRRRKGLKVTAGTAAYQRALAYNMAGRNAMNAWLAQAAAQTRDKVLRNSAQWCLAGTLKVYCKTPTHDSAARVRADSQPRRFVAYFGHPQGAISEQQVPYLRKRRGDPAFDNTNVEIEAPSGGAQHADGIDVVDPVAAGKAYFFETIKHEVQHAADHQPSTDEGHYKTELNARWVDGSFAGYSARRRVQRMGFTWNERQYAVFRDLWSHHDLYPYLKDNWNQADSAKRTAWRSMVVAYTKPESFNPINSVRIQNLDDVITACSPADCAADDKFRDGTGPENAKATRVRNALTALDALDRSTVKTNTGLTTKATTNLSGKLLADFQAL